MSAANQTDTTTSFHKKTTAESSDIVTNFITIGSESVLNQSSRGETFYPNGNSRSDFHLQYYQFTEITHTQALWSTFSTRLHWLFHRTSGWIQVCGCRPFPWSNWWITHLPPQCACLNWGEYRESSNTNSCTCTFCACIWEGPLKIIVFIQMLR